MSLVLSHSKPDGLTAKTFPSDSLLSSMLGIGGDVVYLGAIGIKVSELLRGVERTLTQTPLENEFDPRKAFVERVKQASLGEGWNHGSMKIEIPVEPRYDLDRLTDRRAITLDSYEISLFDALCMTEYVLTNTDLAGGQISEDPRLAFIEDIKRLSLKERHGREWLVSDSETSLVEESFPPEPDLRAAPNIRWLS